MADDIRICSAFLVIFQHEQDFMLISGHQGCRPQGCLGEKGTPRLAKNPLWHPQVLQDFSISFMVPALPDFAIAPWYASFPVAGPGTQNLVATPLAIPIIFLVQISVYPLFLHLTPLKHNFFSYILPHNRKWIWPPCPPPPNAPRRLVFFLSIGFQGSTFVFHFIIFVSVCGEFSDIFNSPSFSFQYLFLHHLPL